MESNQTKVQETLDKVFVDASFADIIPWFLDNRRDDLKKLWFLPRNRILIKLKRMGHRWKGTCASYGFQKLSEVGGRTLEIRAQSGDFAGIVNLMNDSSEYLNHLEVIYVEEEVGIWMSVQKLKVVIVDDDLDILRLTEKFFVIMVLK